MKEDKIIKEFRKRFGRFYCDAVKQEVDIEGNLQIGSDDIEDFILEALSQQKQELLEKMKMRLRKRGEREVGVTVDSVDYDGVFRGTGVNEIRQEQQVVGYSQAVEDIRELLN